MGKSPGKWIKTVLGRRSSRSHSSKESKAKAPELVVGSPVISQEAPLTADSTTNPEPEGTALPGNELSVLPENQGIGGGPNNFASKETNERRNEQEEQAATKVQAAFRGYLARKAFHALRGILRFQAVIRGHLVRRQAVVTLYCVHGIVRLQALARGRRVRLLSEIPKRFHKVRSLEVKQPRCPNADVSYLRRRFPAHTFIYKLLSATSVRKLVRIQYSKEEPNSTWNWLERWTFSRFWKPALTSRNLIELKSKLKCRAHIAEAEAGRPKHSVRRNFSKSNDAASTTTITETDRNRHNPKKFGNLPEEAVKVNPQSELEKVKRNLRKISNSWAQVANQADSEIEKTKLNTRNTSSHNNVPKEAVVESPAEVTVSLENGFEETTKTLEADSKSDQNTSVPSSFDSKPIEAHMVVDSSKRGNFGGIPTETLAAVNSLNGGDFVPETCPLQGIVLDDNQPDLYEAAPKEEVNNETQKTNKRASFSTKLEYPENTSLESPKVPSYMAATESAKAKLRGQSSPRFSLDGSEKNGFIRRHSLPSSSDGKLTSQSPRMQRPIQSDNKGVRSTKSARAGNDKPVRAEWKRW